MAFLQEVDGPVALLQGDRVQSTALSGLWCSRTFSALNLAESPEREVGKASKGLRDLRSVTVPRP